MFESTHQLAENKLILLFVIENFSIPLTNSQITQFILENDYMNYFILQQYLIELVNSKLVEKNKSNNVEYYMLTSKGKKTLEYFENKIDDQIKKTIIDLIKVKKKKMLLKENEIISNYIKLSDTEYLVYLMVIEQGATIIDLRINVATKDQAIQMCNIWKSNSSNIYKKIIELFYEP